MYENNYLVKNSNTIIKWGLIIILTTSLIYLIILSIINKNLKYPREHPYLFTIETLLTAFGMGSIVFLMSYGRDSNISKMTIVEYIAMSIKFGLFHILLQFSGFYSYIYDE